MAASASQRILYLLNEDKFKTCTPGFSLGPAWKSNNYLIALIDYKFNDVSGGTFYQMLSDEKKLKETLYKELKGIFDSKKFSSDSEIKKLVNLKVDSKEFNEQLIRLYTLESPIYRYINQRLSVYAEYFEKQEYGEITKSSCEFILYSYKLSEAITQLCPRYAGKGNVAISQLYN